MTEKIAWISIEWKEEHRRNTFGRNQSFLRKTQYHERIFNVVDQNFQGIHVSLFCFQ